MQAKPVIGGWKLVCLIAAAVIALSAAILSVNPNLTAAMRLVVRVTAYTSLVPFLAAFTASSLVTLAPNDFTRRLLRERRYLGLSFAFSHLVHFAAIVGYGVLNPQFWPSRSFMTNVPGTTGYVFIALLTVTSFHVVSRHISAAAWKRLHTAGIWIIALVFALSFLKRIPTVSALYAIPLAIVVLGMAVRVTGKRVQANKRVRRSVVSGTRAAFGK